jgi:hypothetical protein
MPAAKAALASGGMTQERLRRSLERRLKDPRIGRFKPLCDFD